MISNKTLTTISNVILMIYLSLITILKIYGIGYEANLLILFFVVCYYFLSRILISKLMCIINNIKFDDHVYKNENEIWFEITIITFIIFSFYLIADNPGGFSGDSFTQLSQAINGSYSDWHPVIHTLISFTIPLKITKNIAFLPVIQGLWFSLSFGYLCKTMCKFGLPRWILIIICIYVYINPFISSFYLYLWKDIMLSIVAIVLFSFYIQIVLTHGEWLDSIKNIILFSIFSVLSWYMRHNGLMFVLPILISVICYVKDYKKKLIVVLSFLLFFSSIKVLYKAIDVEKPSSRIVETIGLPLTVWCNVMKNNPDKLPNQTKEKLLMFASQDVYENSTTGNFNITKWSGGINLELVNELSYPEVIKITFNCFVYDFKSSVEALSRLTDTVWDLYTKHGPESLIPEPNEFGVLHKDNNLTSITNTIRKILSIGPERSLFGSIGLFSFLLLFVGLVLLTNNRYGIIHTLPLLCYNYGTMLLLSGPDYRFFALNLVLWIATIFVMLRDRSLIKD